MAFFKLLLIVFFPVFLTCAAVARCEDCFVYLKDSNLQFDLTSFKKLPPVNFNKSNDEYSLHIKLCGRNYEPKFVCNGTIGSNFCLVKNKKYISDIGSKRKEVKLNANDQLFMSFEGTSLCENNKKYTTDMTFVCNKSIVEDKIIHKQDLDCCKHIIELTSTDACPVDDLDVRNICEVSNTIPHSLYKFNLKPLRRSTNNYIVKNQNCSFEVNICGRLTDNCNCGGNITTVCDITDVKNPKVYAVGYSTNDILNFDPDDRTLKLIQYEKTSKKKKGRRVEFIFKCDVNIPPEKTKLKFLVTEDHKKCSLSKTNVALFEVATSVVCIPRMTSCEIFTNTANFNLKPLHKRVGNWIVKNVIEGGMFYLNVCDYLNPYDKTIPTSCTVGGKTSACYVDTFGNGFPVGSTQIGPSYIGDSIILKYTDGINCANNLLKWSTLINFICSHESELIHDSTNVTTCTHVFQWKSQEACKKIFDRNDGCFVTHPDDSSTVYNMSDLKYHTIEINNVDNNVQFLFSICSPLLTPCNGYLNAAACQSINGNEINIGVFTEHIVFDNGKLYMTMEGEKCDNDGPNSRTTIRFVCDYSDSKSVSSKTNLLECTFEFIIYTKNACTRPLAINCSVTDLSGNIFDLSQLTKFDSNYEITIGPNKIIVLNICHSVINNNINATNCQFSSGVCLIDYNSLFFSGRYNNLGDVSKSPYMKNNTIIVEMTNGFYNGRSASTIIEFICSDYTNGPILKNETNGYYEFKWLTPLVCAMDSDKNITHVNGSILAISDHLTSTTTKDQLTTDEKVSHVSFYLGIPILSFILSILWFYRLKLLRGVQKIFNNSQLVRRRRHDTTNYYNL